MTAMQCSTPGCDQVAVGILSIRTISEIAEYRRCAGHAPTDPGKPRSWSIKNGTRHWQRCRWLPTPTDATKAALAEQIRRSEVMDIAQRMTAEPLPPPPPYPI